MAAKFIVQGPRGDVAEANAYISVARFKQHHDDRGNTYGAASDPNIQLAIVKATDYVDQRWRDQFRGVKLNDAKPAFAQGLLTFGGNASNLETVVIGARTYTFKAALAGANDVLVGAAASASRDNLVAAIVGGLGSGARYHAATLPNDDVTAYANGANMAVQAQRPGLPGNNIAVSETGANLSWGASFLSGGTLVQSTEWPRLDAADDQGLPILGIPERLQQAVAEYALRALTMALLIDPPRPVDSGGAPQPVGAITAVSVKVGPVSESKEYDQSYSPSGTATISGLLLPQIPAADLPMEALLKEGLGSGKAIR